MTRADWLLLLLFGVLLAITPVMAAWRHGAGQDEASFRAWLAAQPRDRLHLLAGFTIAGEFIAQGALIMLVAGTS